MMGPSFPLFFCCCCIFGLKSVEQTELGIAIYAQKEEKYIFFAISDVGSWHCGFCLRKKTGEGEALF